MTRRTLIKNASLWFALCMVLLATTSPGLRAADAPAGKPKVSAQALVGQLSNDKYKAREAAQKALIALGADALDAVASGAKSSDPETRSRCEQILIEIQKNLLTSQTEAIKKNVIWKSPLTSIPVGTPAVANNLVLATDADGVLHALDIAGGKEKWHSDAKLGRFNSGRLVTDGTTAYLTRGADDNPNSLPASLTAVEVATGKVLWQTEAQNGMLISPPAVGDGVVYVARDNMRALAVQPDGKAKNASGSFEALDAKNGKGLWKLPLDVTPARPVVGKGFAFVWGEDQKVHAIDLKNHKEAWASEALKNAILATRPDGDKLLVQTATLLVALDAAGKEVWNLELPNENERVINGVRIKMNLVVGIGWQMLSTRGERAFLVQDGVAYLPCGQKILAVATKARQKQWEYELKSGAVQKNGGGMGGMQIGGGQVIIQGNAQLRINGVVVGANGAAGDAGLPVIAGGYMYYGALDGLHAVDLHSRQDAWVLETPGPVCTVPILADGVLYFGVATPVPGTTTAPEEKLPAMYAVKLPPK